jgi:hypothetical protein
MNTPLPEKIKIEGMKEDKLFIRPVEEMIAEHEQHRKRRDYIYKKNQALIKKWNSIPWWKFWAKPSFEEQRDIILRNWNL